MTKNIVRTPPPPWQNFLDPPMIYMYNEPCQVYCMKIRWKEALVYIKEVLWAMTWDFQQCGMCDQQRLRPACAYAQTDQSLCWSLEYYVTVKLLTEQNLEFLSLTRGCTGSSESTLVKMSHCWKSHDAAHITSELFLSSMFCLISPNWASKTSILYGKFGVTSFWN